MMLNETLEKITRFQAQNDFDKKVSLLKIEEVKKDALYAENINKHRLVRDFSFIIIGCILLLTVFGFYQYKKQKKAESQQSLTNERLRISQELHDEVGATLSGISMYSHLSREQNKQNKSGDVENSLKIIQQNAGEMVSKLGEIVWLTNPGQDSLLQLAQRLEEYLYDMAMVKNFKVKSGLVDNIANINLSAEIRRNIYLLFKEAINNAVKYSNATLIELHVKDENEEVKITLQDNGNGFDKDSIKRGNGLTNMEQRAKEAGINYKIESGNGKGTLITVSVKIP